MGRKTVYIHRVGTITAGITLVLTGVLFLVRLFFPFFDPYEVIRFWPVLLIMLGIEVLLASSGKTCRVMMRIPGRVCSRLPEILMRLTARSRVLEELML